MSGTNRFVDPLRNEMQRRVACSFPAAAARQTFALYAALCASLALAQASTPMQDSHVQGKPRDTAVVYIGFRCARD
jgi:hypothetical protein